MQGSNRLKITTGILIEQILGDEWVKHNVLGLNAILPDGNLSLKGAVVSDLGYGRRKELTHQLWRIYVGPVQHNGILAGTHTHSPHCPVKPSRLIIERNHGAFTFMILNKLAQVHG